MTNTNRDKQHDIEIPVGMIDLGEFTENDHELLDVLLESSHDELNKLCVILQADDISKNLSKRKLCLKIANRIQLFGGTPHTNNQKRHGACYHDIVVHVAQSLKIQKISYAVNSGSEDFVEIGGQTDYAVHDPNLPIAIIEEKVLCSLVPTAFTLPVHEVKELVEARISQFPDYGKPDQLSRYTSFSSETSEIPTVLRAGVVGLQAGGPIGAIATSFAALALTKAGKRTKSLFQKPVEEIIKPVVLYISFLRTRREAEAAVNEIGG